MCLTMKRCQLVLISDIFGAQHDVQPLQNINGALTHWVGQSRGQGLVGHHNKCDAVDSYLFNNACIIIVINLILEVYCHITSLQV